MSRTAPQKSSPIVKTSERNLTSSKTELSDATYLLIFGFRSVRKSFEGILGLSYHWNKTFLQRFTQLYYPSEIRKGHIIQLIWWFIKKNRAVLTPGCNVQSQANWDLVEASFTSSAFLNSEITRKNTSSWPPLLGNNGPFKKMLQTCAIPSRFWEAQSDNVPTGKIFFPPTFELLIFSQSRAQAQVGSSINYYWL